MALQILEKNGTFYLHGKINTETTKNFMIHFDYILDHKNEVIINIDSVKEIDEDGVKAIIMLYKIALKNNNEFSIIGYGSKDVYNELESNQVA